MMTPNMASPLTSLYSPASTSTPILLPSSIDPRLFLFSSPFSLCPRPVLTDLTTPISMSPPIDSASLASSPEQRDSFSPPGSPKAGGKVKRGRPQQEIHDNVEDPNSQKRKHRRLYARQYRAQMRQKIDEVKKLEDEMAEMKKRHQEELAQSNQIISKLLQLNQQLMPAIFGQTTAKFM